MFDDISIIVTGSKESIIEGMVATTHALRDGLQTHGLTLVDKSLLLSSSFKVSKAIQKKLKEDNIDIQTATEGRYLGLDRGARGTTRRDTHTAKYLKERSSECEKWSES